VIGDIPTTTGVVLVANSLASGLLAVGGAVKLVRPRSAARAWSAAGLPGGTGSARAVGLVMLAIGVGAIAIPSTRTELALAASYVGLAGFVAFLLVRRPGSTSCGCAGTRDVPPSAAHVLLNLAAAGAAAVAILVHPLGAAEVVATFGWLTAPFAIGLACVGALLVALVAEVPDAFRAYRSPTTHRVERDPDRHARADAALAAAGIGPGHPSLWPETVDG